MKRDIVEDGDDAVFLQISAKRRALLDISDLDEKQVAVVTAAVWHDGQLDAPVISERLQELTIELPRTPAFVVDGIGLLELRVEERCIEVARQERRADVDPRVLVDLPLQELRTVRAFLADDLRARDILRMVDDERAALAHAVVLRLVERIAAEVADRAERPPLVRRHDALRGILDDEQMVAARDVHDRVHLAGHASVMHGHDDARALRDGRLDEALVDVHRVGAHVNEDESRPAQRERVRRRRERERRQDDLVARMDVSEDGRHLERVRPRRREQDPLRAEALLHPRAAFLAIREVAADLAAARRVCHVRDGCGEADRLVERDERRMSHVSSFLLQIIKTIPSSSQSDARRRRRARRSCIG